MESAEYLPSFYYPHLTDMDMVFNIDFYICIVTAFGIPTFPVA